MKNGYIKITPCAFHPDELITNFCKSKECLLPMCPKCIRIHSEEHEQSKTKLQFDTYHLLRIQNVTVGVQNHYHTLHRRLKSHLDELFQLQAHKKQHESSLRKKMGETREKLIREFEKSLIDAEEQLMRQLFAYDENLVQQLSQIDESIAQFQKIVDQNLEEIGGGACLKNIINYYAQEYKEVSEAELAEINDRIRSVADKDIILVINEKQANKKVVEAVAVLMEFNIRQYRVVVRNQSNTTVKDKNNITSRTVDRLDPDPSSSIST